MKAFFFDRDGTLIVNKHYLSTPLGIRFLPCVEDLLKQIYTLGYKIFIITNQSGVKRGYYSRDRIIEIHREMIYRLQGQHILVSNILFCDHHPKEGCGCRKPGGYFVEKLIREYDLDINSSFFVGDRKEDILLGKKYGFKTILIASKQLQSNIYGADFFVSSPCEILNIING